MRVSSFVVLALASACAAVPVGQGASRPPGDLRHRLAFAESYVAGKAVTFQFRLENTSARPVWVLKWYTPLEGFWGRILVVTRDGVEVPYRGPLAKRGQPRREDYVKIEPGQSANARLDLAVAYDLSAPGTYRVAFVGRVHDVVQDAKAVPRVQALHRAVDAPGEPVSFRIVVP